MGPLPSLEDLTYERCSDIKGKPMVAAQGIWYPTGSYRAAGLNF